MMLARIESSLRTGVGADATWTGRSDWVAGAGVVTANASGPRAAGTGADEATVVGGDDACWGDACGAVADGRGALSGIRVLASATGKEDGALAGGAAAAIAGRLGRFEDARTTGPEADGGGGAARLDAVWFEPPGIRVSTSGGNVLRSAIGDLADATAVGGVRDGAGAAGGDPVAGARVMLRRPLSGVRAGTAEAI